MIVTLFLTFCAFQIVNTQNNANIYGYNYDSNSASSGINLVQNPNYQFLNDQLANEYAQTYQQEVRQYDQSSAQQSGSGGVSSSSSVVPLVGYYYGTPLTNAQQDRINYQNILMRNPTSTSSGSSNIYGYDYSSSSGSSTAGTYNNQALYSASTTAQPYIYPFGQYASTSAASNNNNNQVLRDQTASSTRTYTLFDQSLARDNNYQSQSDLKTTTLRDQGLPSSMTLRGAGPMPGPTLGSTSSTTTNQILRDQPATTYYYSGNSGTPSSTTRTSTNYNTAGTSGTSQVLFDATTRSTTTDRCQLTDPYWCSDYVNVYVDSKRNFENASLQSACQQLIQSLVSSYNGCCQAVRSAGCST